MDKLFYRFPGEAIVRKEGSFITLKSVEGYEGFIVANFDQSNLYAFEEGGSRISNASGVNNIPKVYSKEEYVNIAENFLSELRSQGIGKAVFSRVSVFNYNVSSEELFLALCETYPDTFVYCISSKLLGDWIGATPEILIDGKRGDLKTMALAGTRKINDDLPWSTKEKQEQQMVTDFISEKLHSAGIDFTYSRNPRDYPAGPVKHLITEFLIKSNRDAISVATELHPTPAVNGLPVKNAIDLIRKYEQHDRELYSGFLGVVGPETSIYINLRCAKIIGDKIYLFVGGGFTKDSDVLSEWSETENKARTLLNVLENL